MFNMLTRNWWLYAARGVVALIFGLVALIWPEQMKLAIVLMFGAYALVDGILTAFAGIAFYRYFQLWWVVLLKGVVGTLIGLLTFFWPDITGRALVDLMAAWALITGIFEIVAAIQLRRVLLGEWMVILGGLLSILLGVLLFVYPAAGAVSLVWLIGIYAIVAGILLIILAFRLRSLQCEFEAVIEGK